MAYLDTLRDALAANAERVAKPVPVEVPHVGTLYVRPRLIGERDAAEAAAEEGDSGALADGIARILCGEDGQRISAEDRPAFAALLAKQPEAVLIQISRAADGGDTDPN